MILQNVSETVIILSTLFGAAGHHHTTDYAPKEGYNETFESKGLQVESPVTENVYLGAYGMLFNDSFDQDSHSVGATAKYEFGHRDSLHLSPGIAAGYLATSYYDGLVINPYIELGYNRLSAQVAHFPKMSNTDSVTTYQVKLRLFEFGEK